MLSDFTSQNQSRKRTGLRIVTWMTAFFFAWTQISWAELRSFEAVSKLTGDPSLQTAPSPERFLDPDGITLPESIGVIKRRFRGKPGKVIVHIQDAHANEEAQLHIAEILNYFQTNYGLHLVNIEGAKGELYTRLLSWFPDKDARQTISNYFLSEGRMSGPEYAAVVTTPGLLLYGVEDKELYQKNRQAYLDATAVKEEDAAVLKEWRKILEKLSQVALSDPARELIRQVEAARTHENGIPEYIQYLASKASQLELAMKPYREILSFVKMLELQKSIQYGQLEAESFALVYDFTQALPKRQFVQLLTLVAALRAGQIERTTYFQRLAAALREDAGTLDAQKYPNLRQYLELSNLQGGFSLKLFDEMKALEEALKKKIFRTEDEFRIDGLFRIADVYDKMFDLKMTPDDAEFYFAHEADFESAKLRQNTSELLNKYRSSEPLPSNFSILDTDRAKVEAFYQYALQRDKVLIENSVRRTETDDQPVAAFVTGGFHTPGIEKELEARGVSYLVISPSIKGPMDEARDNEIYNKAMQGTEISAEKILRDGFQPSPDDSAKDPRFQLAVWQMIAEIPDGQGTGLLEGLGVGTEESAAREIAKDPQGMMQLFVRLLIAEHVFRAGRISEPLVRNLTEQVENSGIHPGDIATITDLIRTLAGTGGTTSDVLTIGDSTLIAFPPMGGERFVVERTPGTPSAMSKNARNVGTITTTDPSGNPLRYYFYFVAQPQLKIATQKRNGVNRLRPVKSEGVAAAAGGRRNELRYARPIVVPPAPATVDVQAFDPAAEQQLLVDSMTEEIYSRFKQLTFQNRNILESSKAGDTRWRMMHKVVEVKAGKGTRKKPVMSPAKREAIIKQLIRHAVEAQVKAIAEDQARIRAANETGLADETPASAIFKKYLLEAQLREMSNEAHLEFMDATFLQMWLFLHSPLKWTAASERNRADSSAQLHKMVRDRAMDELKQALDAGNVGQPVELSDVANALAVLWKRVQGTPQQPAFQRDPIGFIQAELKESISRLDKEITEARTNKNQSVALQKTEERALLARELQRVGVFVRKSVQMLAKVQYTPQLLGLTEAQFAYDYLRYFSNPMAYQKPVAKPGERVATTPASWARPQIKPKSRRPSFAARLRQYWETPEGGLMTIVGGFFTLIASMALAVGLTNAAEPAKKAATGTGTTSTADPAEEVPATAVPATLPERTPSEPAAGTPVFMPKAHSFEFNPPTSFMARFQRGGAAQSADATQAARNQFEQWVQDTVQDSMLQFFGQKNPDASVGIPRAAFNRYLDVRSQELVLTARNEFLRVYSELSAANPDKTREKEIEIQTQARDAAVKKVTETVLAIIPKEKYEEYIKKVAPQLGLTVQGVMDSWNATIESYVATILDPLGQPASAELDMTQLNRAQYLQWVPISMEKAVRVFCGETQKTGNASYDYARSKFTEFAEVNESYLLGVMVQRYNAEYLALTNQGRAKLSNEEEMAIRKKAIAAARKGILDDLLPLMPKERYAKEIQDMFGSASASGLTGAAATQVNQKIGVLLSNWEQHIGGFVDSILSSVVNFSYQEGVGLIDLRDNQGAPAKPRPAGPPASAPQQAAGVSRAPLLGTPGTKITQSLSARNFQRDDKGYNFDIVQPDGSTITFSKAVSGGRPTIIVVASLGHDIMVNRAPRVNLLQQINEYVREFGPQGLQVIIVRPPVEGGKASIDRDLAQWAQGQGKAYNYEATVLYDETGEVSKLFRVREPSQMRNGNWGIAPKVWYFGPDRKGTEMQEKTAEGAAVVVLPSKATVQRDLAAFSAQPAAAAPAPAAPPSAASQAPAEAAQKSVLVGNIPKMTRISDQKAAMETFARMYSKYVQNQPNTSAGRAAAIQLATDATIDQLVRTGAATLVNPREMTVDEVFRLSMWRLKESQMMTRAMAAETQEAAAEYNATVDLVARLGVGFSLFSPMPGLQFGVGLEFAWYTYAPQRELKQELGALKTCFAKLMEKQEIKQQIQHIVDMQVLYFMITQQEKQILAQMQGGGDIRAAGVKAGGPRMDETASAFMHDQYSLMRMLSMTRGAKEQVETELRRMMGVSHDQPIGMKIPDNWPTIADADKMLAELGTSVADLQKAGEGLGGVVQLDPSKPAPPAAAPAAAFDMNAFAQRLGTTLSAADRTGARKLMTDHGLTPGDQALESRLAGAQVGLRTAEAVLRSAGREPERLMKFSILFPLGINIGTQVRKDVGVHPEKAFWKVLQALNAQVQLDRALKLEIDRAKADIGNALENLKKLEADAAYALQSYQAQLARGEQGLESYRRMFEDLTNYYAIMAQINSEHGRIESALTRIESQLMTVQKNWSATKARFRITDDIFDQLDAQLEQMQNFERQVGKVAGARKVRRTGAPEEAGPRTVISLTMPNDGDPAGFMEMLLSQTVTGNENSASVDAEVGMANCMLDYALGKVSPQMARLMEGPGGYLELWTRLVQLQREGRQKGPGFWGAEPRDPSAHIFDGEWRLLREIFGAKDVWMTPQTRALKAALGVNIRTNADELNCLKMRLRQLSAQIAAVRNNWLQGAGGGNFWAGGHQLRTVSDVNGFVKIFQRFRGENVGAEVMAAMHRREWAEIQRVQLQNNYIDQVSMELRRAFWAYDQVAPLEQVIANIKGAIAQQQQGIVRRPQEKDQYEAEIRRLTVMLNEHELKLAMLQQEITTAVRDMKGVLGLQSDDTISLDAFFKSVGTTANLEKLIAQIYEKYYCRDASLREAKAQMEYARCLAGMSPGKRGASLSASLVGIALDIPIYNGAEDKAIALTRNKTRAFAEEATIQYDLVQRTHYWAVKGAEQSVASAQMAVTLAQSRLRMTQFSLGREIIFGGVNDVTSKAHEFMVRLEAISMNQAGGAADEKQTLEAVTALFVEFGIFTPEEAKAPADKDAYEAWKTATLKLYQDLAAVLKGEIKNAKKMTAYQSAQMIHFRQIDVLKFRADLDQTIRTLALMEANLRSLPALDQIEIKAQMDKERSQDPLKVGRRGVDGNPLPYSSRLSRVNVRAAQGEQAIREAYRHRQYMQAGISINLGLPFVSTGGSIGQGFEVNRRPKVPYLMQAMTGNGPFTIYRLASMTELEPWVGVNKSASAWMSASVFSMTGTSGGGGSTTSTVLGPEGGPGVRPEITTTNQAPTSGSSNSMVGPLLSGFGIHLNASASFPFFFQAEFANAGIDVQKATLEAQDGDWWLRNRVLNAATQCRYAASRHEEAQRQTRQRQRDLGLIEVDADGNAKSPELYSTVVDLKEALEEARMREVMEGIGHAQEVMALLAVLETTPREVLIEMFSPGSPYRAEFARLSWLPEDVISQTCQQLRNEQSPNPLAPIAQHLRYGAANQLLQQLERGAANSEPARIAMLTASQMMNVDRQAIGERFRPYISLIAQLGLPDSFLGLQFGIRLADGGRSAAKQATAQAWIQLSQQRGRTSGVDMNSVYFNMLNQLILAEKQLSITEAALRETERLYQDAMRKSQEGRFNEVQFREVINWHIRARFEYLEALHSYDLAEGQFLRLLEKLNIKDWVINYLKRLPKDETEVKPNADAAIARQIEESEAARLAVPPVKPRVMEEITPVPIDERDTAQKMMNPKLPTAENWNDPIPDGDPLKLLMPRLQEVLDKAGIPYGQGYVLRLEGWARLIQNHAMQHRMIREDGSMDLVLKKLDGMVAAIDILSKKVEDLTDAPQWFKERYKGQTVLEVYKKKRDVYFKAGRGDSLFGVKYGKHYVSGAPTALVVHLREKKLGTMIIPDANIDLDLFGLLSFYGTYRVHGENFDLDRFIPQDVAMVLWGMDEINGAPETIEIGTAEENAQIRIDYSIWLGKTITAVDQIEHMSGTMSNDEWLRSLVKIRGPLAALYRSKAGKDVDMRVFGDQFENGKLGAWLGATILNPFIQNIQDPAQREQAVKNFIILVTAAFRDDTVANARGFYGQIPREIIYGLPSSGQLRYLNEVVLPGFASQMLAQLPAELQERAKANFFVLSDEDLKQFTDEGKRDQYFEAYRKYVRYVQQAHLLERETEESLHMGRLGNMVRLAMESKDPELKAIVDKIGTADFALDGPEVQRLLAFIKDYYDASEVAIPLVEGLMEEAGMVGDQAKINRNDDQDVGIIRPILDFVELNLKEEGEPMSKALARFKTLYGKYVRENVLPVGKQLAILDPGVPYDLRNPDHMGFLIADTAARMLDGWEATAEQGDVFVGLMHATGKDPAPPGKYDPMAGWSEVVKTIRRVWDARVEAVNSQPDNQRSPLVVSTFDGRFFDWSPQDRGRFMGDLKKFLRDYSKTFPGKTTPGDYDNILKEWEKQKVEWERTIQGLRAFQGAAAPTGKPTAAPAAPTGKPAATPAAPARKPTTSPPAITGKPATAPPAAAAKPIAESPAKAAPTLELVPPANIQNLRAPKAKLVMPKAKLVMPQDTIKPSIPSTAAPAAPMAAEPPAKPAAEPTGKVTPEPSAPAAKPSRTKAPTPSLGQGPQAVVRPGDRAKAKAAADGRKELRSSINAFKNALGETARNRTRVELRKVMEAQVQQCLANFASNPEIRVQQGLTAVPQYAQQLGNVILELDAAHDREFLRALAMDLNAQSQAVKLILLKDRSLSLAAWQEANELLKTLLDAGRLVTPLADELPQTLDQFLSEAGHDSAIQLVGTLPADRLRRQMAQQTILGAIPLTNEYKYVIVGPEIAVKGIQPLYLSQIIQDVLDLEKSRAFATAA
jgi:hypothetical protein